MLSDMAERCRELGLQRNLRPAPTRDDEHSQIWEWTIALNLCNGIASNHREAMDNIAVVERIFRYKDRRDFVIKAGDSGMLEDYLGEPAFQRWF